MQFLKKLIKEKGGFKIIISTVLLIVVALIFIIIGVIYSYYDGDWGKIWEMLSSDFAIMVYVILGLVVLFICYITVITNRNKEIK